MSEDGEKNRQYFRYPKEFMKDVFIELHLFDNPEREEHSDYIDIQMKHDLFSYAYGKISDIELIFLRRGEEYLKLKTITKCDGNEIIQWWQKLFRERKIERKDDDMLACENWTLDINGQREVDYRVEIF